ncbi:insulinase family protein [bacterium]|nr:insulinase family protein [bacterium]
MKLELGKVYQHFELKWIKEIKEISNTLYFFKHKKNGAELIYFQNDDINKVFTIAFKTLPEDSCGTPHILEHSVLNGSRKYPCKEPFMELVKGSLKTFINAMTASDKTMYPVASTNDKDFMNLMDVYLDAVLYPKIYDTEEIFLQEGWHHEIFNKEDDVIYNGVVYNEMKGAFSSPESIIYRKIQGVLNPDNCYSYESGGDPDVIPELSYEKFLNFHKRYYHPSNSYISLYGDLDLEAALKKIDGEYLTNFDLLDIDTDIPLQKPFAKALEDLDYYPIGESDSEENKTYICHGYSVGSIEDATTNMAIGFLGDILIEMEGAPLKEAMLEAGLGQDVFSIHDSSILQPVLSFVIKNTNASEKDKVAQVITNTLTKLVENGIDKKLIEAVINSHEFQLREADTRGFPKGLFYQMRAFNGWMHCHDPKLYLEFEERINYIRKASQEGYFENLIKKYLLENTHQAVITLLPKKGLTEEKNNNLSKSLAEYKKALKEEELNQLIQKNEVLRKRQQTPDSDEELAKIPHIELSDISPTPQPVDFTVTKEDKITYLEVDSPTNKIALVKLDFDAKVLEKEDWNWLGLLDSLLTKVDTKNYKYNELSNEIHINLGEFSTNCDFIPGQKDRNEPKVLFRVFVKALLAKIEVIPMFLEEILLDSKFDNKNRIQQVIRETKSRLEMMMVQAGHILAINQGKAQLRYEYDFINEASGYKYYKFICDLEKNFEDKYAVITSRLKEVSKKIFTQGFTLAIEGASEDNKAVKEVITKFINKLPQAPKDLPLISFQTSKHNLALTAPINVQYTGLVCDYEKVGIKYKGSAMVINNILSSEYLYNNIRVQGGAYGAIFSYGDGGHFSLVSYRDPNLAKTYKVYEGIPQFLEQYQASPAEMSKQIIGSIANIDIPLTPRGRIETSTHFHYSNVTPDYRLRVRTELLNTRAEDVKAEAENFRRALETGLRVTVGSNAKIQEDKELFDTIENIFE